MVTFLTLQQMQSQVSFNPGVRTGLAFSTISEMHGNYKTDFYVGGFGEINLTKRYSLQPEINYSRQGSNDVVRKYTDPDTATEKFQRTDLDLDYISFSILNKLTFGSGIQVQFGPALDVLVHDNLVKRKEYNDLSFVTGFAYWLPSGLTFEVRVKKGLLDVLESSYYYNDQNSYFFGNYNTNISFQLGVSYSFKEKNK